MQNNTPTMNPAKHIKRLFKSLNKRLAQPIYRSIKPLIRWIKNDPYEIHLVANTHFESSDFAVVNHVLNYEYCDFNSWRISSHNKKYTSGIEHISSETLPIFIIIDTKFHDAFGHWFFESAIWIPKIKFILDRHKNAKILLKESKGYKTQILDYFGIAQDRVTTQLVEGNNLCIFVNPCTSLNDSRENARFKKLLTEFSNQFQKNNVEKTIDTLLMPRQKKGNYVSNDRQVNTDDIETYIESIPRCEIFNTDNSPTFLDQVYKVQASKHLIVADGSAFMVNAFLAKNSVVIVLGHLLVPNQRQVQEKTRMICEYIEHRNAVTYVRSANNVFIRESIAPWLGASFRAY